MTTYVESSALLKRYVTEADSPVARAYLEQSDGLVTGRHTIVEVRRNLARLLTGNDLERQRRAFAEDLDDISLVEVDEAVCEAAATIAEQLGVRSLDALHLGAVMRAGGTALPVLTFDLRLAQAARTLGLTVLGG